MKTKLFPVFKTSPGNTAGKVGLMDGTNINRDILVLKNDLGLMAGTYGTSFLLIMSAKTQTKRQYQS